MKLPPKPLTMLFVAGVMWVATSNLMAQDKSTRTETPGQASVTTQVERAEVVYVSGNDLVVKTDTGEVRHLTVPDSARATVDGKEVTVHDLKPGMKLQRTVTTTTTPKTVKTVRTITGTVFAVNAPNTLILSFPDGSPNKQYKIPKDQVFVVDGVKKTAFELKKGMPINATAVSEAEEVSTSEQRVTTGTAPPPPRPATPAPTAILLIEVPVPVPVPVPVAAAPAPAPRGATPAPAPAKAAEPPPAALPKTASPLPLVELLGLLLCLSSLAFRARHQ